MSPELPESDIRRIVRQNFGKLRLCYENGLKTDPTLQGKVMARFTIAKDGSVSNVADAGSTIKDKTVVTCAFNTFKSLKFPAPEGGGIVIVTYPIVFSPGDSAPSAAPSAPPPPPAPPATRPSP